MSNVPFDSFDEVSDGDGRPARGDVGKHSINSVYRVPVRLQVVLGSTRMTVEQVLRLSRGSVVELDKKVGDPVEFMINDRIVARGDLVVVDDDRIGVTLTEIVKDTPAVD